MASIDIEIRNTLRTYLKVLLLVFSTLYIILGKKSKDLRELFFVSQMRKFSQDYENKLEVYKEELFHDFDEIESGVIDLRNRGLLRILEIGIGGGGNLKYYPQQCRLIVADPNVYFKQHFMENKSKFPDIFLENYLETQAEDLSAIDSDSVDIVVTTIVLCSVINPNQVLREILRVLVPGGKYCYIEHVRDDLELNNYQRQNLLSSTLYIWPFFAGCWLDRPIDEFIEQTGFSNVTQRIVRIDPQDSKLFKLIEPHVVGFAVK